jgi:hypothetical protein
MDLCGFLSPSQILGRIVIIAAEFLIIFPSVIITCFIIAKEPDHKKELKKAPEVCTK